MHRDGNTVKYIQTFKYFKLDLVIEHLCWARISLG